MSTMQLDTPRADQPFRHEAFFYTGPDQFLDRATTFLLDGLEADEPALVMVGRTKIDDLRTALNGDADRVFFADMSVVGENPARIIPAWEGFVTRHAGSATALRGIGEPIWPGRTPAELDECHFHESLLNVAFGDTRPEPRPHVRLRAGGERVGDQQHHARWRHRHTSALVRRHPRHRRDARCGAHHRCDGRAGHASSRRAVGPWSVDHEPAV